MTFYLNLLQISAKTGLNVESVLQSVIECIPPPTHCDRSKPFRALLFDSWYDRYRGVIALIAVIDGQITAGDELTSKLTGKSYQVKHVGVLRPNEIPVPSL